MKAAAAAAVTRRRHSTQNRALKVGIVGAGYAGNALALLLGRQGHSVVVFEKSTWGDQAETVGAGIGMQPIGLSALYRMKPAYFDHVMNQGVSLHRLVSRAFETQRPVLDNLCVQDFHPKAISLGLRRSELFRLLYDEAKQDENVRILLGHGVRQVADENEFGGVTITGEDGNVFRGFDLVVGADGTRSHVRSSYPALKKRVVFDRLFPYGVVHCVVKHDQAVGDHILQGISQVHNKGARETIGVMPCSKHTCSVFWSVKNDEFDASTFDLVQFKRHISRLMPEYAPLFQTIKDTSWEDAARENNLVYSLYRDVHMSRFVSDRVALIGDAANASSPQLGQGANTAIVSAYHLARCLSMEHLPLRERLLRYNHARKYPIWFWQLNSRLLTPVFQGNSRLLGFARNAVFGPMCRVPILRDHMLSIMCGAKRANFLPYSFLPESEWLAYTLPPVEVEEKQVRRPFQQEWFDSM